MNKVITCISCPLGCLLEVELFDDKVANVSGNSCVKGIAYAEIECINPKRIVTTTVRVENGDFPVVSVKTQEAIPKDKIFDCINSLKDVCVNAPVKIGDIVLENVAETGVNIIATRKC